MAAAAAASFVARAPSRVRLTGQKPGVSEYQILNFQYSCVFVDSLRKAKHVCWFDSWKS